MIINTPLMWPLKLYSIIARQCVLLDYVLCSKRKGKTHFRFDEKKWNTHGNFYFPERASENSRGIISTHSISSDNNPEENHKHPRNRPSPKYLCATIPSVLSVGLWNAFQNWNGLHREAESISKRCELLRLLNLSYLSFRLVGLPNHPCILSVTAQIFFRSFLPHETEYQVPHIKWCNDDIEGSEA